MRILSSKAGSKSLPERKENYDSTTPIYKIHANLIFSPPDQIFFPDFFSTRGGGEEEEEGESDA